MKLVTVEWCDAWLSDTLRKDVNLIRETAGWLVTNNKRVVRIALTVDERGPGDVMNIPRSMVRKIRVIDVSALRDEQTPNDDVEPSANDVLEAERGY